jgi:AcrR family transcriptional regulator
MLNRLKIKNGGGNLSLADQPKPSLRERKKAKTRATIQQNALRLFHEQGYADTTVEQIADVSEISPSTFFRYFPTKESVVLDDDYDPIIIEEFKRQPKDYSPIQALRGALKAAFLNFTVVERAAVRKRMELIMSVPELRAASLNQVSNTVNMIAVMIAERVGRDSSDIEVLTFAGAVIGAITSVLYYYAENPDLKIEKAIDDALVQLEAGFPL